MRHLACAAFLCVSGPAVAQTALSLSLETTFETVAEVEGLPDALNCTALFRSLSLVIGPESDYFETFRYREGAMASVSGMLWADSPRGAGQSPDEVFDLLLPMINTATDLYVDHMDATTAATDTPFDDQVLAKFDFCTAFVEALQPNDG